MNETTRRRSIVVGLFVALGLAIFVTGVLLLGNINRSLQSKIRIVSYVDNVNGLQKGNYIWFSGVRVGIVSSLRLRGASLVEVAMEIDSKVVQYISSDAKIKLGSDGFIGNKILIIFGGTPGGAIIAEGDTLEYVTTMTTDDLIGTLQQSNENLKSITDDFKIISKKLATGEGSAGKLLTDDAFYINLNSTAASLRNAAVEAQDLMRNLAEYSEGLKKEGTIANEITSDTTVFNSLRESVLKLNMIADTASLLINHLNMATKNDETPIGVLLNDKEPGADLKVIIANLKVSTQKLNEDLEGLQHSFPMKRYFKKKNNQ